MLLVAVDPAGCAHRVVEEASKLAAGLGEPITLMTAVDLPDGVDSGVAFGEGDYAGKTAGQVLISDARSALDALAENARVKGVAVEIEVRVGHSLQAILDATEAYKPRILVCGTHGRTGLKRLFLGSVAEQIIRRSTVPVLTVHAPPGMVDHPSEAQRAVEALADG